MKKLYIFIVFFVVICLLGLLSSFNIIDKVYQRKSIEKPTKVTEAEKIDPQTEPVAIVQKYINYFYDKNYTKAYGLLTVAEEKTIGNAANIADYTTFPSEIPNKIMLNNREYANGTHSIKASIYYQNAVVIKDFGVIIEDQSWKIDYVKDIKNYVSTTETNTWLKYKVDELNFKYPNTWQMVANSAKQVALRPKDTTISNVKIQIDVQKGLGINDLLQYINCSKIKNSKCFEADIGELEFNEVDSINNDINSNFLVTEKNGAAYVLSITFPLAAQDSVKTDIENIISTVTF